MNNEHQNSPEPAQTTEESGWYYLVGEKTCGPSTTEQIRSFIASGALPLQTYVFRDGMKDWAMVREVPALLLRRQTNKEPDLMAGEACVPAVKSCVHVWRGKAGRLK